MKSDPRLNFKLQHLTVMYPGEMCWLTPEHFLIGKKCLLFMMLVGVRKKVCENAGQGVIHYFSHRLSSFRRFSKSRYRLISFSV